MRKVLLVAALFISANAHAQFRQCMDSIVQNQALAPLGQKVALGTAASQTFAMIADESSPTNEEKALISDWVTARQRCYEEARSERMRVLPPPVIPISERLNLRFIALAADLYNGKITYGEFAKVRNQLSSDYQIEARAAADADRQQFEAQEEARRQAAAAYMANRKPFQIPRQEAYQMPVPQTTNCTMIGNQMHCTTR